MSKKVIAFDLDGTLAPSKSALPDEMGEQLSELLRHKQVVVISGGKFGQFEKQLLSNLKVSPDNLANLHIMPTCGTRYYRYNVDSKDWELMYAEDIPKEDKQKIIDALNKGFDDLGYREKEVYGECIEDRESQITFSVLGQDIVDALGEKGVELKEAWDPDNKKKLELRDYIAPLIPDYEVRVGGVTSIDVTKQGIDKAYGMQKAMDLLGVEKSEILFIGDRLNEGGNDFPVKVFGIDCVPIKTWQETRSVVEAINKL
ncbi:MAG: HAD-IIB family hydrolase [Bacteroidetes bacterium]|nr:HAD-IIB family hydrolase [Bacteroidota bacterium]